MLHRGRLASMPRLPLIPCCLGLIAAAGLLWAAQTPAASVDQQRALYRQAMESVGHATGEGWKRQARELADYPLLPYLERAVLDRGKGKPALAEVEAFLGRWPDTLVARDLREATLRDLAKARDWKTFRSLWAGSQADDLRCDWQLARLDAGEQPDFDKDIASLWMQPRPTPGECEPLFAWARQNGRLDDAHVWQRIEAAAAAANPGTVSSIAGLLDGAERGAAERIAASVRDPGVVLAKAGAWPDTVRNRDAISYGLLRLARRNSAAAETLWADLGSRFEWQPAQKNRILNALAVYRATSYGDDALARLKALPADAADDSAREWRVRVALATQDWNEVLAALEALSAEQKSQAQWRYLRARILDRLGRKPEAQTEFAAVAREANFHGFLAADWIGAPYAICPQSLAVDAAREQAVAEQADLARALEFFALGDLAKARREWAFGLEKLSDVDRQLAADLAYRRGWFERAVFELARTPATRQFYEQRFPLAFRTDVIAAARGADIDPSWVYAIIRAESAWVSDARSHADAYGLMQLLPGVASQVAKSAGLPYARPRDLFNAGLNIQLGSRFLGQMAAEFKGSPWLASAAYNAGSKPVRRWLDARGTLDPDFFIETIPYKETREYVARVLAFGVIYDWRLHGSVVPLAARMPKIGQGYRAPDADTARKPVTCPASEVAETPDAAKADAKH